MSRVSFALDCLLRAQGPPPSLRSKKMEEDAGTSCEPTYSPSLEMMQLVDIHIVFHGKGAERTTIDGGLLHQRG